MLRLVEVGCLVGIGVVVAGHGGRSLSLPSCLVQIEVVVVLVGIATLCCHAPHPEATAAGWAIVVVAMSLSPLVLRATVTVLETVSSLTLARHDEPRWLVRVAALARAHVRQGESMVPHHAALATLLYLVLVEVVRRPLVVTRACGSQRWQTG